MTNPTENVIDMRSLGGNGSGESKKEDGSPLLTSPRRLEDALNASHRAKRLWNTFFVLSCCAAVFVDPLFCYIYVIHEDTESKYMTVDTKLAVVFIGLRLIVDVLYMIDIIISVLRIVSCKKLKNIAKQFGACCGRTKSGDQTTEVRSASPKGCRSINASLIRRSLVALPIVEISLLLSFLYTYSTKLVGSTSSSTSTSPISAPAPAPAPGRVTRTDFTSYNVTSYSLHYVYITISIQYILRIYDIYASLRRRPILKIRQEIWLKPILDFLPFILASHLFGALWYFLAIQQQQYCWRSNCNYLNNTRSCLHSEKISLLLSEKYCPIREENTTMFNFGIYLFALKSDYQNGRTPFLRRLSLSFWWALRNLSSFGSNLNTSSLPSEIYFSVLISISGMVLFLVYLNARVQETKESFKELNAKKQKQLMIPDVDLWLSRNDLPKDLKTDCSKKKEKDLKTVIMDNIHKLENNKVINVQSILYVLPILHKNQIVDSLCMASLRKVPLLETMNENVLKGIAEHLKPVIYNEDSYIVKEGKPLGKMLFITQGIAWTYTTNGSVGTICDSKWLERGSFCGEELLNGASKSPFLPDIPISTRTVISQEQVEAFAIRANDLKSVVVKFWWHFSEKVTCVSQLKQWEHLAACSIQATWRRHHCAKARGRRLMRCGKNCFKICCG